MPTQLISANTRGVFTISPTPFNNDELDFESTENLVEFYIQSGVDGITILGVLGEAPKLSDKEAEAFIDRVMETVAGRVPVIVGCSRPGVKLIRALADKSMEAGASGIMLAPPTGIKTESQLAGYFNTVFDQIDPEIPVCLQDYPASTGVYMSPQIISQIFNTHPNLVMLKHEDFPGQRKLSTLLEYQRNNAMRQISILVANAGINYPLELRRGANGVMTGFSFPEMLVQVFREFSAGNHDLAEDIFDCYLPLLRYEFQPGMGAAIRKEVLHRRKIISSAQTRAPGPILDTNDHAELTVLLNRLQTKLETASWT